MSSESFDIERESFFVSQRLLFDIKDLFLFIALFTYPFSIQLNNIFFGGAFVLIVILNKGSQPKLNSVKKNWPFLLLPIIYLHVIIFTFLYDNKPDLIYIEKYASFFFFPLLVYLNARISSTQHLLEKIGKFIIFSALFLSLVCFIAHVYKFISNDIDFIYLANWEYVNVNFTAPVGLHTTYAGFWALIAIVILIETNLISNQKFKFSHVLIIIILTLFILFVSSRIILGCIILYFFIKYYSYFMKQIRNKKYFLAVLSALLIIVCLGLIYQNISVVKWRFRELTYNLLEEDYSKISYGGIKIRLIMWECSIKKILDAPLLGGYIGEVGSRLKECYENVNFVYGAKQNYGSHNQYLSMALNFGFFGLLFLVYLLIKTYRVYLNYFKQYSFVILFFAICFLVENMLSVQKGIVIWSFFISTGLSLNLNKKDINN